VSTPDTDPVTLLAREAAEHDGVAPFDEATLMTLARHPEQVRRWVRPDAAALAIGDELALVVRPAARGRGEGSALLGEVVHDLPAGELRAWSHGDHPAAAALAARHGFERVRTLLHLRLPSLTHVDPREATDGIRIETFDPATDASDWLAVNARAFAGHPEQGRMTADDLAEREAESWFDPSDFLVARDGDGRMLGFHWMKLEPGADDAEVYVLGVDPDAAGRGLGSALLTEGLLRMRARGRTSASLYVEGDNDRALGLYRRAGFVDDAVDVQYRRAG